MSNDITTTTSAISVSAFTGKEIAPAGFRLVALHYKSRTDKETKKEIPAKPAVYCCVPQITVSAVEPQSLLIAVQDAVNELQDSLVRYIIDEQKKVLFPSSDVEVSAIAAFAATQAISKRLNKEVLGSWFDASLQDKLMTALTSALNIGSNASDVEVTKLIQAVQQHRNKVCELSAPRPAINVQQAKQLSKAVSLADNDLIKVQLLSKLDALSRQDDVEFIGL